VRSLFDKTSLKNYFDQTEKQEFFPSTKRQLLFPVFLQKQTPQEIIFVAFLKMSFSCVVLGIP
jgi:hypothetical protein